MNKPLRRESWFRRWGGSLALILIPLLSFSQDCEDDFMVMGSNYVCQNQTLDYNVVFSNGLDFLGGTRQWKIEPAGGGVILGADDGPTVKIDWNGASGVYNVILELSNFYPGCVGTFDDTLAVEVTSDFGRSLACNDTVQVSLGTDCQALVTADMVLEGQMVMEADYTVEVKDINGNIIPGALLDGRHAGQLLEVKVVHNCSGNSCWGNLRVEDKIGPTLECQDIMIGCEDDTRPTFAGVPGFPLTTKGTSVVSIGGNSYRASGVDSCGTVTLSYSDEEESVSCIGVPTTSVLYAVARNDDSLRVLDTLDGSIISSIQMTAPGAIELFSFGLATDPSTNTLYILYKIDNALPGIAYLGTVDPNTGVITEIKELGVGWNAIAFNALGDKLYAMTGNAHPAPERIYELDKYCGDINAFVCNVNTGPTEGEAFAVNPFTDDLYRLTDSDEIFESIDPNTCGRTPIDVSSTPLHGDNRRPLGMTFDVTTGDFIVSDWTPAPPNSNLYRLSPDGEVTPIGSASLNIKGLAFVTQTPIIKTITRTWSATDESGNTAECTETIDVRAGNFLAVACPENYDDIDNPALDCTGGFRLDQNGNPHPSVTGYPTGGGCENIDYDYIDYRLSVCESSYKIVREWLIADWCTGQQTYCNQIIKVLDKDGPQVSCPPNDTFSVMPFECIGMAIAPNPLDYVVRGGECAPLSSIVVEVSVIRGRPDCTPDPNEVGTTDGVVKLPNGDYKINDLPTGCSWIIYKYTDPCGNSTECRYDVFIEENQKPVPVCDQHTTVTLSSVTGTARVYATTFDDGSYDNCGLGGFKVRRMTAGDCPTGVVDDTEFRDYVEFCCSDVANNPIMVVLRVFDAAGNYNECMVEVNLVDKNPPDITCPPNITVSCGFDIPSTDIFGTVRDNEDDREDIIISDPGNPNVQDPTNWGRDGFYYDECGVTPTYSERDNRNSCGVGTITRTWTVRDGNGARSCSQRITVRNFNPFDGTGIVWPKDTTLDHCPDQLDPDELGSRPILPNTGECADLLVSYKDQVYSIVDSACYKVIRNWTVLDWCNNDTRTNSWSRVQIIKVKNTTGPTFINNTCRDKFFETESENCTGYAELTVEVDDDCTDNADLEVSFEITLQDGKKYSGTGRDASGTYDVGRHEICWTVKDKCDNESQCCHRFTIRDRKKPTPYCLPGIITVVMPSSGQISIWANDFDDGSYDNCTEREDLRFSFSSNVRNTSLTFDCDDIEDGIEETFDIEVWVTDEDGNQDFCRTKVTIQDGIGNICPDQIGNSAMVSGNITTEEDENVEEVMVMLDGNMPGLPKYKMTETDGHFAFPSIPTQQAYNVEPSRNDDHLNGVSTLDLILIQRHLLGISSFNSPYKFIAADVNNSESISARDIVELRKLILGFYSEFPNNKSWRFITEGFIFSDPNDPFPYDEYVTLDHLTKDEMENDFIAVKIGDINGDAKANKLLGNVVRGTSSLDLETQETEFRSGQQIEVTLDIESAELLGFQYAIQFDQSKMLLNDIIHQSGLTSDANIGLGELDHGVIAISWNADQGQPTLVEGKQLTLVFEALSDGKLSESFGLNTKRIQAEAYLNDLEVSKVQLNFLDQRGGVVSSSDEFELFQNQPNPFDESTFIGFNLPKLQDATVTVFDVTGKIVKEVSGTFSKGYNQISISASDLGETGVLYYRLETTDRMSTKKMILIE